MAAATTLIIYGEDQICLLADEQADPGRLVKGMRGG
jgi:hypothetical protein